MGLRSQGDASQMVWLEMLQTYLPKRYQADTAFIVDSKGIFSEQIDVVIFARQSSPFIFKYNGQTIIPAESVYGVFEAKQTLNLDNVKYAQNKISSVRKLYQTSLPIPHAGGEYPAKPPIPIIGGILTFESDWSPPLGDPLKKVLDECELEGVINIGCVASHGYFDRLKNNQYVFHHEGKPATAFLLKLISRLQFSGTVPMIDVQSYAKWLS